MIPDARSDRRAAAEIAELNVIASKVLLAAARTEILKAAAAVLERRSR